MNPEIFHSRSNQRTQGRRRIMMVIVTDRSNIWGSNAECVELFCAIETGWKCRSYVWKSKSRLGSRCLGSERPQPLTVPAIQVSPYLYLAPMRQQGWEPITSLDSLAVNCEHARRNPEVASETTAICGRQDHLKYRKFIRVASTVPLPPES